MLLGFCSNCFHPLAHMGQNDVLRFQLCLCFIANSAINRHPSANDCSCTFDCPHVHTATAQYRSSAILGSPAGIVLPESCRPCSSVCPFHSFVSTQSLCCSTVISLVHVSSTTDECTLINVRLQFQEAKKKEFAIASYLSVPLRSSLWNCFSHNIIVVELCRKLGCLYCTFLS